MANGAHAKSALPAIMTSSCASMYSGCLGPLLPRGYSLAQRLGDTGYGTEGIEFDTSPRDCWVSLCWVWKQCKQAESLHIHFIQSQLAERDWRASFRRLLKSGVCLLAARLVGYRIAWTMHELVPTWPMVTGWSEMAGSCIVGQLAHGVAVQYWEAQRLLARSRGVAGRICVRVL